MSVQIVTNDKGEKTSVLVSFKDWEKMNNRIKELEAKVNLVKSIQAGIKEVKEAGKSGKKLQRLSDFINESRG